MALDPGYAATYTPSLVIGSSVRTFSGSIKLPIETTIAQKLANRWDNDEGVSNRDHIKRIVNMISGSIDGLANATTSVDTGVRVCYKCGNVVLPMIVKQTGRTTVAVAIDTEMHFGDDYVLFRVNSKDLATELTLHGFTSFATKTHPAICDIELS